MAAIFSKPTTASSMLVLLKFKTSPRVFCWGNAIWAQDSFPSCNVGRAVLRALKLQNSWQKSQSNASTDEDLQDKSHCSCCCKAHGANSPEVVGYEEWCDSNDFHKIPKVKRSRSYNATTSSKAKCKKHDSQTFSGFLGYIKPCPMKSLSYSVLHVSALVSWIILNISGSSQCSGRS